MASFKLKEIVQAIDGELVQGDPEFIVTGICTDSRKIKPGDLFLALVGENFNGHNFVDAAIKSGAAALLVMQDVRVSKQVPLIRTGDTLKAFGAIARFHREKYQVPIIGVTGSNGKTTTKDLVAAVLSRKLEVVKTEANYNNEIGLPLTLLRMSESTAAVVVEMGMRGLGQIRTLANIAKPEIGIITNIGQTHLELLGSQANIAKAKAELIEALPDQGIAILNGDDPWVRGIEIPGRLRVIWYGIENPRLDYAAEILETTAEGTSFSVRCPGEKLQFYIPLPGRHNVLNALAAIVTGRTLGLSFEEIRLGLKNPDLTGRRLKISFQNQLQIIDDTYNASPASVKAALEVLSRIDSRGRKVAILADMLELGDASLAIHREIGAYAAQLGLDYLFAYGNFAGEYLNGFNSITPGKGEYFTNKPDLIQKVKFWIKPGDSVLIKGSRGMKMEEVVEALSAEEVAVHD